MNPSGLHVPDDVAALLGVTRTAAFQGRHHPDGLRCERCSQYIDGGTPAAMGLYLYQDGAQRLWFTHRGCGPGGVVHRKRRLRPGEVIGTGLAGVAPLATGDKWPIIIVEFSVTVVSAAASDGSAVDEVMAYASRQGMHPVGDIFHIPPASNQWEVRLPYGGRAGGVYDAEGESVLAAMPSRPADWASASVSSGGRCAVYLASRIDLANIRDERPDQILAAVLAAGSQGRLAGVTAPILAESD